MAEFLRAFVQRAEGDKAKSGPISFVASTPGVKRDGLDLAALPWTVANYARNPVVTWCHDFGGNRLPIGRGTVTIDKTEDGGQLLFVSIDFDEADPFAADIARKYRDGFLHTVSVSWDDVDGGGVPTRVGGGKPVAHDLLEIAAVPVPGDPEAVMLAQRSAMAALGRELLAVAGEGADAADDDKADPSDASGERSAVGDVPDSDDDAAAQGPVWANVAAEMVAVFAPDCPDDDRSRRRRYNALLARYRVLGRTPPEFISAAEVDALGVDEWRGLWLEGELDGSRVGAVLNARNRELLTGAADAINAVLKSADGGEDRTARTADARAMDPGMIAEKLDAIVAALADLKAAVAGDAPADQPAQDAPAAAGEPGDERAADDLTDDELAALAADLDALAAA